MNFTVDASSERSLGERGERHLVRGQAAKAAGQMASHLASLFPLFDGCQKRIGCTRRSSEGIDIAGGQVLKF
jgi:hypothetical protein